MTSKIENIISILFALFASWIILVIPYFRLGGLYPQVDTQIIFLHMLTGLMSFLFLLCYFKNMNSKIFIIP